MRRYGMRGGALIASGLLALVTACGTTPAGTSKERSPIAVIDTKDDDGLNGTLVADPPLRIARVMLRDTAGRSVDLAQLPSDKVTIVFFGYTHCPDVCPTTMADLAAARRLLRQADANRVNIRFITVDPARDTPGVLRRWLGQFHTDAIGLRGSRESVNAAERSLYADESSVGPPAAEASPSDGSSGGASSAHDHGAPSNSSGPAMPSEPVESVSHSGSVYVFAPHGKTVLYTGGTTAQEYADDLHVILSD